MVKNSSKLFKRIRQKTLSKIIVKKNRQKNRLKTLSKTFVKNIRQNWVRIYRKRMLAPNLSRKKWQETEVTSSISGTKFNDGFQSKLNNISLSGINLGQIIQNGVVDLLSWELGQYRGQVLFIVGQSSLNFFFQPRK